MKLQRILALILALALSLGMVAFAADEPKPAGDAEFQKFMEIYEKYNSNFFKEKSAEKILLDTLKKILEKDPSSMEVVLDSFLKSGDPFSRYIDEQEVYDMNNAKVFGGVGITVKAGEVGTVVAEVTGSTPAAKMGMEVDDVLMSIDGHNVSSLSIESISQLARGEVGAAVEYVVYRPSTSEMLTFKMTRETITIETVTYEIVEDKNGDYALCRINDFQGMTTYFEFVDFKSVLETKGIKKVIFDVRNNPGGDLSIVLELINWLIPQKDKTIVKISPRDMTKTETFVSTGRGIPLDKIIILVDEHTASAAELFAISLQDHKLATVVGQQTFGKAIGQTYFSLKDGTVAAITTIQVASPNGVYYNERGVIPDIVVKNSEIDREVPPMLSLTTKNFEEVQMDATNDAVQALEERLVFMGYMSKSDKVFDKATVDALNNYQRRAGLLQSGALDFETFESINETVTLLSKITVKNDDQLKKAKELIIQ